MIMNGRGDEIPVSAFHFLSSEESAGLLPAIKQVIVKKGEALFRTGDVAEGVFFLEKGRLAVLKETGFNHRTQVVALLEPGASVGEGGVLGDSSRSATIMAIEESILFYLDRRFFVALGEKDPQILIRILKRLLYTTNLRLQKSSERLAHIL
jgi:CRP/FNR family transcriptional regulator, cyclic AMP receptor protein